MCIRDRAAADAPAAAEHGRAAGDGEANGDDDEACASAEAESADRRRGRRSLGSKELLVIQPSSGWQAAVKGQRAAGAPAAAHAADAWAPSSGERVEVCLHDAGWEGSWYGADVRKVRGSRAHVRYAELTEEYDVKKRLEQWVDAADLRPLPPAEPPEGFARALRVGASAQLQLNDGWWQVQISAVRKRANAFAVVAPLYNTSHEAPITSLRPDWDWYGGCWVDGATRRRFDRAGAPLAGLAPPRAKREARGESGADSGADSDADSDAELHGAGRTRGGADAEARANGVGAETEEEDNAFAAQEEEEAACESCAASRRKRAGACAAHRAALATLRDRATRRHDAKEEKRKAELAAAAEAEKRRAQLAAAEAARAASAKDAQPARARAGSSAAAQTCLLYTSDAAD